ncbi:hypothetical protein [Geomesophilobacter sediminis]|uniref:Uncharacterized protein n=1 Tax=Geomesophilobacter sediminis TaxID=2798584 RepID=A0A8J7IKS3_9BACT|nr:hypothetical protein [Geomesophilobacter sediminis]MBJ6723273.1 hypothetical protein [Geomesophilobacter sediminis]
MKEPLEKTSEKTCDTRIWSPDCERGDFKTLDEKFLCVSCGTIPDLNHEVHHEMFPHISGDHSMLH